MDPASAHEPDLLAAQEATLPASPDVKMPWSKAFIISGLSWILVVSVPLLAGALVMAMGSAANTTGDGNSLQDLMPTLFGAVAILAFIVLAILGIPTVLFGGALAVRFLVPASTKHAYVIRYWYAVGVMQALLLAGALGGLAGYLAVGMYGCLLAVVTAVAPGAWVVRKLATMSPV